MDFETTKLHIINSVAHIQMNRPDRRNAFNSQMIADLTSAFESLKDHPCRSIILSGEGNSFSAGADLNWMREMKEASQRENVEDALKLARLMEVIYTHPKPVVAKVHGAAMGGGVGLIAACDIALARKGTIFAFSEVRLGLVPAVIAPYVIRKIGQSAASYYMLTAENFDANTAKEIGLIAKVEVHGDFDTSVRRVVGSFESLGPQSLSACKQLIHKAGEERLQDVQKWTAELIARLRVSDEGQEGIAAFLDHRDPEWS